MSNPILMIVYNIHKSKKNVSLPELEERKKLTQKKKNEFAQSTVCVQVDYFFFKKQDGFVSVNIF